VLHLLGAGSAYPKNIVDNPLLRDLGFNLAGLSAGVSQRHTCLSIDYLKQTKNVDPWLGKDALTESPSDLTLRAARTALDRAGIKPEELGLIIGETSAPLQTTPSEAQRVGNFLGVKIPAYDVASFSSALLFHLNVLSSWKKELLPKYVLCVSCNTVTQKINYSTGLEGYYLGDSAAALVVGNAVEGKLVLSDSWYKTSILDYDLLAIEAYGSVKLSADFIPVLTGRMKEDLKLALSKSELKRGSFKFIGNQLDSESLNKICEEFGIAPDCNLKNLESCGYGLGSSSLSVLADNWDKLGSGEKLVIAEAGAAFGHGFAVLES